MDNQESHLKIEPTQGFDKLNNYFNDLVKSNSFQQQIKEIRDKFGISVNSKYTFWENHLESPPKEFKVNIEIFKHLVSAIYRLCESYGLIGIEWFGTIMRYIFSGEIHIRPPDFISPYSYDVCGLKDVYELWEEMDDPTFGKITEYAQDLENLKYPISIAISPYATQRDILDFVKKNDARIKELQEKYKKATKIGLVKKKRKRERDDFIYKNRTKTLAETKRLVEEKYGERLDYEYIGKIRSQEKKKRTGI